MTTIPEPTAGTSPATPAAAARYGGFWVRLVAFILDGIVIGLVTTALLPLVGVGPTVDLRSEGMRVDAAANAWSTLIGLVYFVGFWAWRGQTPGMMPFDMHVVSAEDGGKIDWVRALLRYAGLIISIVVLFLGVIWAAFDARKQGWHDKIARTVVVRS